MLKCETCDHDFQTPQGLTAHKRWVHEGKRPEPRVTEAVDRAFLRLRSQYQTEAKLAQDSQEIDLGKVLAWGFIGWLIFKALEGDRKKPRGR